MNGGRQKDEIAFLESVVKTYITSESQQDCWMKTLAFRAFAPLMGDSPRVLEFGCLDGFMTSLIEPHCRALTVVDGSTAFIEMARKRVSAKVEFVHALFEEYDPGPAKFDRIFATYVLEHVVDAVEFLRKSREMLAPGGLLFLVVPNARAMSRQLARHMGLLDDLFALTQNDIRHGHRRVYDRVALSRDIETAGLRHVFQGGLLLKPLADFQMDQMFTSGILGAKQMEGLYRMGLEYPELAASIFSICSPA